MRITIKEVAKQAKVSQTTVSFVLNDAPGVSEATRQRVLEVIKALNYKPSALARSFSSSRAEAVALVMPPWSEAFDDPYFTQILRGVLESVRDRGYKMLIEVADERFIRQKLWRDLLEHKRVDGLMIAMPYLDAGYLADMAVDKHPVLLINGVRRDLPALDTVGYDDVRCGFDATYYLLGLGHRRIVHFAGPPNQSSTEERITGYRDALNRAHVPFRSEDVMQGEYTLDTGRTLMERLLMRPRAEWPTALFCANDNIAVGALEVAKKANLSIPHDLSIIGVDDSVIGRQADPPLTTLRQDLVELGFVAAAQFLAKLECRRQAAPLAVKLPMVLVERASCARPGC